MALAPDAPTNIHRPGADPAGVLNLLRNAVEAMQTSPRRELTITTTASVDRMVEVSVTDSGPGLAADVRDKLFRSFMTTKPAGMGVGLSICLGIVEAHCGRMWLGDNPGGGAAFHFTLPVAGADAEEPETVVEVACA
jgi:two-component system sensor kinase FixL